MRFIVLLTSLMLASLGMASDADQRDEREDILIAMQQSSDVAQWVIDTWKNFRASYVPRLAALGAEAKTVSEWREQWTREGKAERITRYLTGKDDDTSLWYLSFSKADADKMAELGMEDISIGYLEHWEKFQELTLHYNVLTRYINKLVRAKFTLDIKILRFRLAAMNDDLDAMRKDIKDIRKKVKATRKTVKRMLARVKAQNLGLQFVAAYHESINAGLHRLEQAEDALGEE